LAAIIPSSKSTSFAISLLMHCTLRGLVVLLLPVLVSAQSNSRTLNHSPLGKLVNAAGHRLHINCSGKGTPTVVIENGTGDFSFDWIFVQPLVARFAQVCTYDRAGYAWSEPGPKPRTFQQITMELHAGLRNAGVTGPYILVGQSYGGFLVRAFARYYPKETAGMVLVDALNEDSRVIINNEAIRIREMAQGRPIPPPQSGRQKALGQNSSQGVLQSNAQETKLEPPLDKLPRKIQRIRLWAQSQPDYEDARHSELDWSPEELARMFANRGKDEYKLGDIPLIVLTRTSGGYSDGLNISVKQLEEERLRLQAELAKLSHNSKHIVARNSGHNIHLEAPELVVDAIREVVKAARSHNRLPR